METETEGLLRRLKALEKIVERLTTREGPDSVDHLNVGTATGATSGQIHTGGDAVFGGNVTVGAGVHRVGEWAAAAAPQQSGAMTVTMDHSVVTLTPTNDCTFNASGGVAGQFCAFLINTSGTVSFNMTWNTNFVATGVLATGTVNGKRFTVTFACRDGTNWYELARSVAM